MTNKLYYNDPLIACYMAREFGVKYSEKPDGTNELYWCSYMEDDYFDDDEENRYDKAYIHPDSYHIFEPQVGDWGNEGDYPCSVCGIEDDGTISVMIGDEHAFAENFRIMVRNNRPFFWPESEEV